MSSQPTAPRVIRFGLFELDLSVGELRKQGRNIKLQDQPLQVLELLLSRPSEVVTREELQQVLWPEDTFVEFDQGLNTAIKKIRVALGDSADNPNKMPHYQDAHLELDFSRGLAALDAHRLVLTRKEYELLSLLVENAGEIVPREVLLMRIWGYSNQIRTRTLDVHIRRLRTKLGSYSREYLETIFGIGYRFQPFHANRRYQAETPSLAMTAA